MVEIEWDGIEMSDPERESLMSMVSELARIVDPDGRARLEVAISGGAGECTVSVDARDSSLRLATQVREAESDVTCALERAVEAVRTRWLGLRVHR